MNQTHPLQSVHANVETLTCEWSHDILLDGVTGPEFLHADCQHSKEGSNQPTQPSGADTARTRCRAAGGAAVG